MILFGALLLEIFHRIIPHDHLLKAQDQNSNSHLNKQILVVLAVALHNLPEGLSVGVGVGSGDNQLGSLLAYAIAFQDLPEGLVVALGLVAMGLSRMKVLLFTAAAGLIESLGVLLGFFFIGISQTLLAPSLAVCAGAMLYVISHEMIPESHRNGHEKAATYGVLFGFILMMSLDLSFA